MQSAPRPHHPHRDWQPPCKSQLHPGRSRSWSLVWKFPVLLNGNRMASLPPREGKPTQPLGQQNGPSQPPPPRAPTLRLSQNAPRCAWGKHKAAEFLFATRGLGPAGAGYLHAGHQRWACCCETRLISALVLPHSGRAFLPSRLLITKSCLHSKRRFPAIVLQDLQLDAKFSAYQPPPQCRGKAQAPSLPLQNCQAITA